MDDALFDLSGQVALVTGGNSGIGLGLATGLARAGSAVCIWGTNAGKNAAALETLRSTGTDVMAMIVDVSEERAVEDGMNVIVSRYGRLDSCFANAAVTGKWGNPRFVDSTLEAWRAEMAVNLDGTYLTLRAAARQMIAQGTGGSLVGTSSLAAEFGAPREAGYAAAKAAILALMRTLAVELGKYNIRANALLPGWTRFRSSPPGWRSPASATASCPGYRCAGGASRRTGPGSRSTSPARRRAFTPATRSASTGGTASSEGRSRYDRRSRLSTIPAASRSQAPAAPCWRKTSLRTLPLGVMASSATTRT